MRRRLFEIVETSPEKDTLSTIHDIIIFITILISIVPLMFKKSNYLLHTLDLTAAYIFIVDYALRLITADFKLKKGKRSFFIYPFTPFAIIDLVSILPSVIVINSAFKLLRIFRVFKTMRLFKAF